MKKVCEICGKEKPLSEFSKSYKNRCKECVAEITRENRRAEKEFREIHQIKKELGWDEKNIDWETRRYELAKEYSKVFINLQQEKGRIDCGCYVPDVVEWSVEIADALIAELKKNPINNK
jgi:hypothetical protein